MASIAVFSSCKKDKDENNDNSKKGLLTKGTWKIEAAHEKLGPSAWSEITDIEFMPCELDDRLQFSGNNIVTTHAGAVKCNPADAETETAEWHFINGEQGISLDGADFEIVTLTANSLQISVSENIDGMLYTLRISFVH